jgi:DNA-binding MarR family transcriptional regulator
VAWELDFLSSVSLLGNPTAPRLLDRLERSFWLDFSRSPVLDAIEEDGAEARRYGPVLATMVAELPDAAMLNIVTGATEPGGVVDGYLAQALEWIESLGVDCRIPITPGSVESDAAEELLNQFGYRHAGSLVRFVRKPYGRVAAAPDFPEPPGIEVVEVDEFTEGFGRFPGEGFGLDLSTHCFFDGLPGRDSWRSYVALDEREWLIASASMMLHFEIAQLASDLDVLLVLAALRVERRITAQKAAPLLQRDLAACQRALDRMQAAGLLEPTRSTARRQHPTYKLSQPTLAGMRSALTYRVETIDGDDAKLIRHLKRHRRISNEDVRNYLDCDVPTARNRLTRMRRKGWIEFAPDSPTRGPNVEYAATAKIDALSG